MSRNCRICLADTGSWLGRPLSLLIHSGVPLAPFPSPPFPSFPHTLLTEGSNPFPLDQEKAAKRVPDMYLFWYLRSQLTDTRTPSQPTPPCPGKEKTERKENKACDGRKTRRLWFYIFLSFSFFFRRVIEGRDVVVSSWNLPLSMCVSRMPGSYDGMRLKNKHVSFDRNICFHVDRREEKTKKRRIRNRESIQNSLNKY